MKEFLLIGVVSLVGPGSVLWGIGMLLPSQVTGSRSAELKASPAEVFQTVTNIEEQAEWRKDTMSHYLFRTIHYQIKSRWQNYQLILELKFAMRISRMLQTLLLV